jgi:hypothetical protein
MSNTLQLNEQTIVRVAGYQAAPGYYDKNRIYPPVVVFELGASCGACGAYGIHLTPDQARGIAEMLIASADKATGAAS